MFGQLFGSSFLYLRVFQHFKDRWSSFSSPRKEDISPFQFPLHPTQFPNSTTLTTLLSFIVQRDSAPRKKRAPSFPSFHVSTLLNPIIISCGCHTSLTGAHTCDAMRTTTVYAMLCTTPPQLWHLTWSSPPYDV